MTKAAKDAMTNGLCDPHSHGKRGHGTRLIVQFGSVDSQTPTTKGPTSMIMTENQLCKRAYNGSPIPFRMVTHIAMALICALLGRPVSNVVAADKPQRDGVLQVARKLDVPPFTKYWAFAYSPDGKTIAGGSLSGIVDLWDANNGKRKTGFNECDSTIQWISFSADGKMLASASATEQLVSIRRIADGKLVRRIKLPAKFHSPGVWFHALTLSRDGKMLFAVMQEIVKVVKVKGFSIQIIEGGDLIAWDTTTGRRLWSVKKSRVGAFALSPDGTQLAGYIHSATPTIKIWDTRSGELKQTYQPKFGGEADVMRYTPDGKKLILIGTFKMYVWEIGRQRIESHEFDRWGGIMSIRLSRDGSVLGRAGFKIVELTSVQTGKSMVVLRPANGRLRHPAFSPNLDRIVASKIKGTAVFRVPRHPDRE